MENFSERYGHVKKPEFLQLNCMNERLSNLLLNFAANLIEKTSSLFREDQINIKQIEEVICNSLGCDYDSFKISPPYQFNGGSFSYHEFKEYYTKLSWHEKYTVIEAICTIIIAKTRPDFGEIFIKNINAILERENSGYRASSSGELIAITDEVELQAVEEVRHHSNPKISKLFDKAISSFSDREQPNYPSAVKDAVSALEALAQHLSNNKHATLGGAVKKLNNVPMPLQKAIGQIYGYASNEGNIRHGNIASEHTVDFDEAKFVIVNVSALINFISARYKEV